jgi:HSP20 family molecular chaperone IbpA
MSFQENDGFKKVQYKHSKNSTNISRQEQEIKNLQRRIHSPKVDLIERDSCYLVRIELPGIKKSSISVKIKEDQIVFISGSKISDELLETDNIIYKESKFNDFTRRIKLPGTVEQFNNHLNLENGILKLVFNKKLHDETTTTTTTTNFENLNLSSNEPISWADM